jgi:hypothetical protein
MNAAAHPSIIKRTRVHVGPVAAAGAAGAPCARAEKRVRLLEHEGVVRAIELTCSCGEVSVVELDYDRPRPRGEGA